LSQVHFFAKNTRKSRDCLKKVSKKRREGEFAVK